MHEVLSLARLNRATLARQLLLERSDVPALDAIERLCGIQAQEAKPPFVGLWSRLAGFDREDLHKLLHDRSAVRATFLRGTLHVLSARDYAAFRAVIQPVLTAGQNAALKSRSAGLDEAALLPARSSCTSRNHAASTSCGRYCRKPSPRSTSAPSVSPCATRSRW